MRFLIVERQYGGGCDYTIGCGVRVTEVEAESMAALVDGLKARAFSEDDDCGPRDWLYGEQCRESVTIYHVPDEPFRVPLDPWRAEKRRAEQAAAAKRAEEEERATLERLRKKYPEAWRVEE